MVAPWLVTGALVLAASPGGTGAIQALAERTAQVVTEAKAEPPIALAIQSQSPALGQGFATLLAARLAVAGLPAEALTPEALADPERSARGLGARAVLKLSIELRDGVLGTQGELFGVAENFWSGIARTRPSTPAVLVALSVTADEAARLLARQQPPVASPNGAPLRLDRAAFARVDGTVAALVVADADGDGRRELLVLTDRSLIAFGPDGKAIASQPLAAPRSSAATRIPFGALAVLSAPPRVAARLTSRDRAETFVLDARASTWKLADSSERDGVLVGAGTRVLRAAFVAGQTAFEPSVALTTRERWSLPASWVSAASWGAEGPVFFVLEGGRVEVRGQDADRAPLPAGLLSGAALACVDLEGDGKPELLVSSPEAEPAPELLRILSLGDAPSPAGEVALIAQWELGTSVRHAAAGDLDGDGAEDAFAALSQTDGTTVIERISRSRGAKP